MKQLPTQSTTVPPLFVHAEITAMEAERARLKGAIARMKSERNYGAIQRLEFKLRDLSGRILAKAYGKGPAT